MCVEKTIFNDKKYRFTFNVDFDRKQQVCGARSQMKNLSETSAKSHKYSLHSFNSPLFPVHFLLYLFDVSVFRHWTLSEPWWAAHSRHRDKENETKTNNTIHHNYRGLAKILLSTTRWFTFHCGCWAQSVVCIVCVQLSHLGGLVGLSWCIHKQQEKKISAKSCLSLSRRRATCTRRNFRRVEEKNVKCEEFHNWLTFIERPVTFCWVFTH